MNSKLFPATCLVLSSMFTIQINAQEYQSIPIQGGFNADVIANGVGPSSSSTSTDVDGVNYAFISTDFQATAASPSLTYGLPVNGIIASAVGSTSGLNYQMASYSSNNSLKLQNIGDNGTLTFSTPIAAVSLYMLATGGSGDCTVDVNVNFSDGTSQAVTGLSISDWYNGSNYAIQGIGRVNITDDTLDSGGGTNPRLYQIPVSIDAANQSKSIQSVTVTKAGGGIPNIFAFSAEAYNSCPAPSNITDVSNMTGATLSWTAPFNAPSSGYQYYVSTSPTAPTATTTPTGSVAAGTTSVALTGLATGETYYFWVRSNCGSSQGIWKMKQFMTGQISATYTAGDINTLYYDNGTPITTDVTSCPGVLTISVPAGYKIKSTDVSYTMTTVSNGWMSEQHSLLVCSTSGTTEPSVTSGSGSTSGTYSYNRTGLSLANGLVGNVNFELRAWRTFGGSDCNADYNKVDNNTWKVTVTLEPLTLAVNEAAKAKERIAYPNPFTDFVNIENAANVKRISVTDLSGIVVKTIDSPASTLHLGELKTGVYILAVTMKDGSTKSLKMIKK